MMERRFGEAVIRDLFSIYSGGLYLLLFHSAEALESSRSPRAGIVGSMSECESTAERPMPSPAGGSYELAVRQLPVPGAKNCGSDTGPNGNRVDDSVPIVHSVIKQNLDSACSDVQGAAAKTVVSEYGSASPSPQPMIIGTNGSPKKTPLASCMRSVLCALAMMLMLVRSVKIFSRSSKMLIHL